jgi:hypothetical protein
MIEGYSTRLYLGLAPPELRRVRFPWNMAGGARVFGSALLAGPRQTSEKHGGNNRESYKLIAQVTIHLKTIHLFDLSQSIKERGRRK